MNILMLTDRLDVGGAETHIYTLALSLKRMGHRVVAVSSGGHTARRLSACGIRHITLPTHSHSPADIALCISVLSRILHKHRFDIIHAHARMPALLADLLSRRYSLPLIVTAHASFSPTHGRSRLSRWGSPTIAVSEDLKQHLCSAYSLPPENVRVIPNGIDPERFYPAKTFPKRPWRIITVSRLDRDCSLAALTLFSIAPRLSSALGRIEIIAVGGGDMLPTLRHLASEVNRTVGYSCIRLAGQMTDVAPLLRSCHIFVGVSRAALEAVFCGLSTVLCGNEGYLGELTAENFALAASTNLCARGFSRTSADVLRSAIISICTRSDARRREDATALRTMAASVFDSGTMAEQTLSVYTEAISNKQVRSSDTTLLCGYYGFSNMGDDALLRSAISRTRAALPNSSLCVLTRHGRQDRRLFGERCVRRTSPVAVVDEILRCRRFVLGGGTLLQETTSLRSLAYYWALTHLATATGADCYILGGGIDPPRSLAGAAMMSDVLRSCRHVGLRDTESVLQARRLAPTANVSPQPDLALSLAPSPDSRTAFILTRLFSSPSPPPFILVTPKHGDGLPSLISALHSISHTGMSLCFVAMHKEQDLGLVRALAKRFGGAVAEDICYSDLLALISRSSGVLTMRLHALLAARAVNVPCRAFGSEPKLYAEYFS